MAASPGPSRWTDAPKGGTVGGMRAPLVAALVIACGCAAIRDATNYKAPPPAPPPPPTAAQLAPWCSFYEPTSAEGAALPFATRVVCPIPEGVTRETADLAAAYRAAPLAVLLEREVVFVGVDQKPAPRTWSILAYFSPGPTDPMFGDLASAPGVRHFEARQMLNPPAYADLRGRAEILKEDRVYAGCRAFVLDIDAAGKDPGRATACARAIETIDRSRSMRQASAAHAEMASMERERISLERERMSLERRAINDAASARAWQAVADSLRSMKPVEIQMPAWRQTVRTDCTTFGNRTNCTSR